MDRTHEVEQLLCISHDGLLDEATNKEWESVVESWEADARQRRVMAGHRLGSQCGPSSGTRGEYSMRLHDICGSRTMSTRCMIELSRWEVNV